MWLSMVTQLMTLNDREPMFTNTSVTKQYNLLLATWVGR